MLRTVPTSFPVEFSRSGGAIIDARCDIWQAEGDDWNHVAEFVFGNVTASSESLAADLPVGNYTGVFKCYVEESLNGKYNFELDINGMKTYFDSGDVNTTGAKDDSAVYKDQFSLVVE